MRDEEKAHYLFLSNSVTAIAVFCTTVAVSALAAIFLGDKYHAMIIGSVCGLITGLRVKTMDAYGALIGVVLVLIFAAILVNVREMALAIVFAFAASMGIGCGAFLKLSTRIIKNFYKALKATSKNPR